ncbi:MAG: Flp family type IVb pilin [Alphaproteobacteria bacterium]
MLKTYVALSSALEKLKDDIEGASLVEYALLVALVAIVVIGALNALSDDIGNAFNQIGNKIRTAVGT